MAAIRGHMMLSWMAANPSASVAIFVATCSAVLGVVKWGLGRHRDHVAFAEHLKREESELWPSVAALDKKLSGFHLEVLALHAQHGERLARLEARMPNGELRDLKAAVDDLSRRVEKLGAMP